jgi:hypothetical protein
MLAFWKIPRKVVLFSVAPVLLLFAGWQKGRADDPAPVRSQAVVNLTFDEESDDALDTATVGAAKDNGKFVSGAGRVNSPFPKQSGKRAVVLDADSRQFIQIPDSPDLDRPDAVTFSLFFVNLQPANDTAYHGIVAKRDEARQITNYGINYSQNGDVLQLYINTGSGYKSAVYSLNGAVGRRRPVFITASLQVGDAPAPDADEDQDDLLLRFYINGQPVKPKAANGGTIVENDVWLTDVNGTQLLNDVPLTIGASNAAIEHTSCLVDEFSLFARALSPADVMKLFNEVAGPATPSPADHFKPPTAGPAISSLSLHGLTRGHATVIAVTGTNLLPDPVLVSSAAIEKQVVRPGATAERVEFEVTTTAHAPAGHFPLRIQTAHGISGALPIAVDSLPQLPFTETSPEKPLPIPVAVSGTLSGQQQVKIFFAGKSGQRAIIDLECRRLGATMDPVLELRNPRGAPLNIAWGRPQLRGDTRIEAHLFTDGVYSVEFHDLAFKAPAQSQYRLKIGDLKLVDTTFPAGINSTDERDVIAIGPGFDPAATLRVKMQRISGTMLSVPLLPETGAVAPSPSVLSSGSLEVLEQARPQNELQTVNATFADPNSVVINGRITRHGETDVYALQVTPGTTLKFSSESYSFHSPLEAHLEVRSHPEGKTLAMSEDQPALDFAVPAGTTAIQLAISDLNRRGGPDFVYRLRMTPAGFQDFSLSVAADRVLLPHGGTAVLRVDVNRNGFDGPVALELQGLHRFSISPAEIPAGASKALLVLQDKGAAASPTNFATQIQLLGRSVVADPRQFRVRAAQVPFDGRLALLPELRTEMTCILTSPAAAAIELGALPVAWFRGVDMDVPVALKVQNPDLAKLAVRLTLLTTEATRNVVDPSDPTQQRRINLPIIRSLPEQSLTAGESSGAVRIAVPLDIAENQIDAVIRADFVPNPFSETTITSIYSPSFRLPVQDAVTLQLAANNLTLAGNAQTKFTGTIKRTASFVSPIDVSILNLPAGYSAPKFTIAADQEQFELIVTSPAVTAAANLPNIQLRVTTPTGALLQKDTPIATNVTP